VKHVSVRVIDEDDLAEVLADYRGKVVLVDFWATWCLACIELFPHTVALHGQFAEEGLAVISVSFDQPESRQVVLDFLKKHGATFDNFISRYGAGVESAERFGLPGTLPQLLLFDRQGELAHTFPEPQSGVNPEQVDQAVKELLGIAR
jgi:thiol-disulfide isomerase/thioredoxin